MKVRKTEKCERENVLFSFILHEGKKSSNKCWSWELHILPTTFSSRKTNSSSILKLNYQVSRQVEGKLYFSQG